MGEIRKNTTFRFENFKGRDYLEDIGVHGKIILNFS